MLTTPSLVALAFLVSPACALPGGIQLTKIGEYRTHQYAVGASEIPSYDYRSHRIFVINGGTNRVDVLDAADPTQPRFVQSLDLSAYGANPTSVATRLGLVAVAVGATVKTNPGRVVFFDAFGAPLGSVEVGALPDMLVFTPDGKRLLVANEGEPSSDYLTDPLGTVSIIDVSRPAGQITQADVATADFSAFDGAQLDPSVRIFGPNASVAQDLEPEYIAVAPDSKKAWVTLQENNAVAVLDLATNAFVALNGLGFKDHAQAGNELDPSDKDALSSLATWPMLGMYQPDSIAAYRVGGHDYYVTANEGDARDYPAFAEEARVKNLALDPLVFPNAATLKLDLNLGRLNVTKTKGDVDGDGDYDALYAFGARSFSIRDAAGALVYDSGALLEQIAKAAYPLEFNSDNADNGTFDSRSDNKGPEPEGLALGQVRGRWYAFVGLERIGGVAVFDIQDPAHPTFAQYVNPRNFSGSAALDTAGDLGPEGLQFVPKKHSPNGKDLLIVGNEISGSTAIFEIDLAP